MKGLTTLPLFSDKGSFDFNKIAPMPKSLDIEDGNTMFDCIICYLTDRFIAVSDPNIVSPALDTVARKTQEICTCGCSFTDKNTEYIRVQMRQAYVSFFGGDVVDGVYVPAPIKRGHMSLNDAYEKGKIYTENYQKYGYPTWYGWCNRNWGTKWNAYDCSTIDENTVYFNTAWTYPDAILQKLAKMYPDIPFEHWYADEDPSGLNIGYNKSENGLFIPDAECDLDVPEIFEKCWGSQT